MTLTHEQIQQFKEIIDKCIQLLYQHDNNLIQRRGMERSISFRLALYLNDAIGGIEWLQGLNLDMEYNKNRVNPKRTPRRPKGVQPDLIIHKRGNNDANNLVVEIKGWWNDEPRSIDRIKLEDFTHQEGEYRYGLGVFLDINKQGCQTIYYIDGTTIE